MMLTNEWRKSTRSGPYSDNCVEARVDWRKSTRSGMGDACVEVAKAPAVVQVRDSKDPDGPILAFTAEGWAAFVEGLNAGTFA